MKTKRGFTLVETVIYIGLFSLIMSGAVVCAYNIVQGSAHTSALMAAEEENDFISKKAQWAAAHPDEK